MFDIFDYPNITSKKAEEQIKELQDYLVQFKETLEFALVNIGDENLSAELRAKLNGLGMDIETSKQEQEDHLQQMAGNTISVSDVLNYYRLSYQIYDCHSYGRCGRGTGRCPSADEF